jgi:hypothetical protein
MVGDPKTGNPRIWQGNDGQAHSSFELRAMTVKFLDRRDDDGGGGRGDSGVFEPAAADESEIPF